MHGPKGADGLCELTINNALSPNSDALSPNSEAKYGRASIGNTISMGRQMGPRWVEANIRNMTQSKNPEVQATGEMIREFISASKGNSIGRMIGRVHPEWVSKLPQ
jgi:hypothetical protein